MSPSASGTGKYQELAEILKSKDNEGRIACQIANQTARLEQLEQGDSSAGRENRKSAVYTGGIYCITQVAFQISVGSGRTFAIHWENTDHCFTSQAPTDSSST